MYKNPAFKEIKFRQKRNSCSNKQIFQSPERKNSTSNQLFSYPKSAFSITSQRCKVYHNWQQKSCIVSAACHITNQKMFLFKKVKNSHIKGCWDPLTVLKPVLSQALKPDNDMQFNIFTSQLEMSCCFAKTDLQQVYKKSSKSALGSWKNEVCWLISKCWTWIGN